MPLRHSGPTDKATDKTPYQYAYWRVPLGARRAHWFSNTWRSACRYYAASDRGRIAEDYDQRCKACTREIER